MTVEERAAQTEAAQIARRIRLETNPEIGWMDVEPKTTNFNYPLLTPERSFPTLIYRSQPSLLIIFLRFMPPLLVKRIMDDLPEKSWVLRQSRQGQIYPRVSTIYKCIAIYIRIQGLQNKSSESHPIRNPLKTAISEARHHFDTTFNNQRTECKTPGNDVIEKVFANFLITKNYFKDLSANFQSIIVELGQYVAGDEKLFRFTGNSNLVRMVPHKPDKVGLWYYELVCRLRTGQPYLLYFRLHDAFEQTISPTEIVKDWCRVIRRKDVPGAVYKRETMLAFDGYYETKDSRAFLNDPVEGVLFVGSVIKERVKWLFDRVCDKIEKPGDWHLIHNQTTGETFSYVWDTNKDVGKKLTLSNAFTRTNGKWEGPYSVLYRTYKQMFADCDNFNRSLKDRTWPHRKGGRNSQGAFGNQHDFAFSTILQNTFNVYNSMLSENTQISTFRDNALILSDALYEYICNGELDTY